MPDFLIDAVYGSAARLAILPMQDLLGLGAESRMNVPGRAAGNWGWRFDWSQADPASTALARSRAERSDRLVQRPQSNEPMP